MSCANCVNNCPASAISLDGQVHIDTTKCIGCAKCIAECPLKLFSPKKVKLDGDIFLERLVEYAKVATSLKPMVYINVLANISSVCDCSSKAPAPFTQDMLLAGGKQDQYAATFGGFNFMEFYAEGKVIVNPLRIKDKILNELSRNIILFYTATSRDSAKIIEQQQKNVIANNTQSIEAMQQLKHQAVLMKESLLKSDLDKIGDILNLGWQYKRQMARGISTDLFESVYNAALQAGASGGKISGAGGGGYIFFYASEAKRYEVIKALDSFGGKVRRFEFTNQGLETWQI